jgi:hypothetical protein
MKAAFQLLLREHLLKAEHDATIKHQDIEKQVDNELKPTIDIGFQSLSVQNDRKIVPEYKPESGSSAIGTDMWKQIKEFQYQSGQHRFGHLVLKFIIKRPILLVHLHDQLLSNSQRLYQVNQQTFQCLYLSHLSSV